MNTRNRHAQMRNAANKVRKAPYGLGNRAGSMPVRTEYPPVQPPQADAVAVVDVTPPTVCATRGGHVLTDQRANAALFEHEQSVKDRFSNIVPTLKQISALQHDADFAERAQRIALENLGFTLPAQLLDDAWVESLDMRALYADCVFKTFKRAVDEFCESHDRRQEAVDRALTMFLECGYHEVDITPCADGRLKGLVQYILRLPLDSVRSRKAYAGAMFDVEANVRDWMATELSRYREHKPSSPDAGTRYLKMAVYHFSSSDPGHEGCAAHGSDERAAAEAALDRLTAFRQAIENSFCCGASVDTLLIGVDTDTDSIKVHVPDANGEMSLYRFIESAKLFQETLGMSENSARLKLHSSLNEVIETSAGWGWGVGQGAPYDGMQRLIFNLLLNNLSQIDYVCQNFGGRYPDVGHNERLVCVGEGFEEVQIRNLAYFAHMYTLEEGAADVDVGVKIFSKLNVKHGLPIPVIVHYLYNSKVPGSRERIIEKCLRVKRAIEERYRELTDKGLLVCKIAIKDRAPNSYNEMLEA